MFNKFVASVSLLGLVLAAPGAGTPALSAGKPARPKMDLAFCIDTTGSMQGEIDMVKSKVKELVAKLAAGKPAPEIRVGLVAYRDRGDAYVTKVFPFSEDIDHVVKDISGLQAAGGGDGPESVNEALHTAVHDLRWDESGNAAKLLFLIGDAAPHSYPGDFDWHKECREAIGRGIQINTIGCAGLESYPADQGVDVFRQIARLTDGKFDTLAYRQEVATAGGGKVTYVTAGGAVYKLKTADRKAWRAGVDSLAKAGMAERLPAATWPGGVAAAGAPGAVGGLVFGALHRKAAAASEAAAPATPSSRSDNNLADVLLEDARAAAKKTLNVRFDR